MKSRKFHVKIACALLPWLLTCAVAHASDINKGKKHYETNCAVCHGQTGRSVMVGAPNFDRGEGLLRADRSLLGQIREGKNACPAYRGILADQDIFDVIAYLRTLH